MESVPLLRKLLVKLELCAPRMDGPPAELYAKQVESLFKGSKLSPIISVVLAGILVWQNAPYISKSALATWFASVSAISILRQLLITADSRGSLRKWSLQKRSSTFLFGVFMMALFWAVFPWLSVKTAPESIHMLNALFLTAIVSGGAVVLSSIRAAGMAFIVFPITSIALVFFLFGGQYGSVMGVAASFYLLFMLKAASSHRESFRGVLELTVQQEVLHQELERALEEAQHANTTKSQFLANMSHEIRTPMNAILGMTELAIADNQDDEVADSLETVLSSAEGLLIILNEILDFSKIEAGVLVRSATKFELSKLCKSIETLFSARADKNETELIVYVDPKIDSSLLADDLQLKQVLVNLVSNAVKFTERGAVVIQAHLLRETSFTQRIELSVVDTGIGIDEKDQRKVFESFQQADSSVTRLYGGTGLGLAICVELVRFMRGRLGLRSKKGIGSVFSIELAMKRLPRELVARQPSFLSSPQPSLD